MSLTRYTNQLSITVTKYLCKSTYKEERVILTTFSEVSVHGWMLSLL
jgi:hypothetical protein